MANREELLQRLVVALEIPGVDGILATADLIDDLVVLGLLENKVVVGSLNRGGLQGASFEMDDRFGAYTVQGLVDRRLDAAKTLTRINYDDSGTASTLQATAHAVNEASEAKLPIMIEMFISHWEGKTIVNETNPEAVIRSIAIAQALGTSSAYTWLKIPYVKQMERVMEATTLPTVILGGDPVATDETLFDSWAHAMQIDGVRGLMVGRSLLFPNQGSTSDVVSRAVEVVHG
jgi:DhnA family fructose-bisphosphate aldolase class Ia